MTMCNHLKNEWGICYEPDGPIRADCRDNPTKLEEIAIAAKNLIDFWINEYGYVEEDLYPEEKALLDAVRKN